MPATAKYIITSDERKFPNSPFGRGRADRHEKFLKTLSSPSSVDQARPVEPANLFGSAGSPFAGSSAESDELRARETELIRVAAELTDKEHSWTKSWLKFSLMKTIWRRWFANWWEKFYRKSSLRK